MEDKIFFTILLIGFVFTGIKLAMELGRLERENKELKFKDIEKEDEILFLKTQIDKKNGKIYQLAEKNSDLTNQAIKELTKIAAAHTATQKAKKQKNGK